MKHFSIALLLFAGLMNPSFSASIQGKVVGVSDGDTITVLDAAKVEHKIRLSGIDAPEKAQPYGDRSKQHLSNQVFGKSVDIEWNKTDRYGRTIGKVMVGGQDANLSQIRAGLAWHYKQYEMEQPAGERAAYALSEQEARGRRLGLWLDAKPTPPWDFRHGVGEVSAGKSEGSCPCGGPANCTGPKGGTFCISAKGKKKYL